MELNDLVGTLPGLMDNLIERILNYAVVLAAVATVTMTFLELIKAVFKLRLKYHRKKMSGWLKEETYLEELLILTVADVESADALYDQPTDKMLGQIQEAANVAVDYPNVYGALYYFLTRSPHSGAAARETGGTGSRQLNEHPSDAEVWERFITRPEYGSSVGEDEVRLATKARARIDHFIARKLDAFQTQLEYEWARKNQYWSVFSAGVLLMALLSYKEVPVINAFFLSLFGGMMAPLAKDIVAALSGLRNRS